MSTLPGRALAAVLFLAAATAQGQFLVLTDDWGNTVNGQEIHKWADANTLPDPVVYVHCELSGTTPEVVQVRRYEVEIPAEVTLNYFCWGECYAPDTSGEQPVMEGMETQTLFPGEVFEGFHAYYRALGVLTPATFRYVWFDNMNPDDSTWVDIIFHGSAVGMDESASATARFEAYPVPSGSSPMELVFNAPSAGQQTEVEFHDALGKSVLTERIRTGQQRLVLDTDRLPVGLVFATLRVNGRGLATRRLVINGH